MPYGLGAALALLAALAGAAVLGGPRGLALLLAVAAVLAGLGEAARRSRARRRRAEADRDRFFTLPLDMLCIVGPDGRFRRLSPAFTETLGWSLEELLARPFLEFVHPGDRDAARREAERQARGAGTVFQYENRYLHKDGSWRWLSWRCVPETDGSTYATARDITLFKDAEAALHLSQEALVESEHLLRSLNSELERRVEARTAEVRQALATLDATEDGAFIFEPGSLRFTYVNEGAVRQTGFTRAELLGRTPRDLLPGDQGEGFEGFLALVAGGGSRQITTTHWTKDGREVPVEINVQYIASAEGPPRFIYVARDITERRQQDLAAHRSQRIEALGTLAGGVAHDLNNALTPILMGVEALREQFPDAAPGIVDLLEASARRGAALVRQLLAFARGTEGRKEPLLSRLLLTELATLLRSTFPKNIEVELLCPEDLPPLWGDATQIHQILLNLSVNARDAMPNGGRLTLEARAAEITGPVPGALPASRPGPCLVVEVRDTGTGIPEGLLTKIFDPFFSTKPIDKGTGLGLATVVAILKGHEGFLQVETVPGRGTTFRIHLPLARAGLSPGQHQDPEGELSGEGRTLLVVDDEPAVLTMAAIVLRRLGFEVVEAVDGVAGLIRAEDHRERLCGVITDLHMPALDGLDFVRSLRRILPAIPIIVSSGRLDEEAREAFGNLGVGAYLDKPFSEGQIREVLREAGLLGRKRKNLKV
ncbi:PAS domain-containing hybrid sensor histidine kinase/response regulator [Mesoterricola silvestris]|uniref:histidine kinase n=1 Tax=Mesoterricola silvestris TaxID=2927979 RepID=A0AA48GHE9_9BACT|nr:PAS domain S-box protein [Mesoterricola silvestris]BDU71277.1 hypothetical protein METEAL_04510 [Mesoterricola silvestris]